MAADAFAGIQALAKMLGPGVGDMFAKKIGEFVGLPELDERWITPEGRDVTRCCGASSSGGFSSSHWTMQGWVLDDDSMQALKREFPKRFRLGYCHPLRL